jgi:hypothetical protein
MPITGSRSASKRGGVAEESIRERILQDVGDIGDVINDQCRRGVDPRQDTAKFVDTVGQRYYEPGY